MAHFYIVFTDLSGFSKLSKEEQSKYLTVYENEIAPEILPYFEKAIMRNTWGDAVVALFEQADEAVAFMLQYREVAQHACKSFLQNKVLPRIAGHYGQAEVFYDPLLGKQNAISEAVNTAARIEPITRPGEIFVSPYFKDALERDEPQLLQKLKFAPLGSIELPKNAIEMELFHLLKAEEDDHVLDTIFHSTQMIPFMQFIKMTPDEEAYIKEMKSLPHHELVAFEALNNRLTEACSVDFCLQMVELNKKIPDFKTALSWIEKIEKIELSVGLMTLYPYGSLQRVLKSKSDILTRYEQYDDCAAILMNLKNNLDGSNPKAESEIVARLAAQFKRKAIQSDGSSYSFEPKDLQIAADLYTHAFKLDIENYYPAINAAYLMTLLDEEHVQQGYDLAMYIQRKWPSTNGQNVWQDFTYIETFIILQQYEQALSLLTAYLQQHEVDYYVLKSCHTQLDQYLHCVGVSEVNMRLLEVLELAIAGITE